MYIHYGNGFANTPFHTFLPKRAVARVFPLHNVCGYGHSGHNCLEFHYETIAKLLKGVSKVFHFLLLGLI